MEKPPEKVHRKRKQFEDDKQELGHDESNWLVSYADLMTLLFGFFVLMYSFSKVDQKKFNSVRENISEYFGGQMQEDDQTIAIKNTIKNIVGEENIDAEDFSVTSGDGSVVLQLNSDLMFRSGSAELSETFKPVLKKAIDAVLKQNAIRKVVVEGHTDSIPINSYMYPSNWELSTARSAGVVRELLQLGLKQDILSAVGFGASRPMIKEVSKNGQYIRENLRKNRRVVVNIEVARNTKSAEELLKTKKFKPKTAAKKPKRNSKAKTVKSQPRQRPQQTRQEASVPAVQVQDKPTKKAEMPIDLLKDRLEKTQKKFEEANKKAREKERKEKIRQKMLQKLNQLESKLKDLETDQK